MYRPVQAAINERFHGAMNIIIIIIISSNSSSSIVVVVLVAVILQARGNVVLRIFACVNFWHNDSRNDGDSGCN